MFTGTGEECATCGRDAPYLVGMTRFRLTDLREAVRDARATADGDSNDDEIEAWQEVGDLIERLSGSARFSCGRHLTSAVDAATVGSGTVFVLTPKGAKP